MKAALFPGTFDPPTLGHLDLIQRAALLFERLYVAVGYNVHKPKTAFNLDERLDLMNQVTAHLKQVKVVSFSGLLVDCAKELGVSVLLRAVRGASEFECEAFQAYVNRELEGMETLYMAASDKYRLISSSLVREVGSHGRRLHAFVPKEIEDAVARRLQRHG